MRYAFVVASALSALAQSVYATPVTWAGNGHTYDIVTGNTDLTWAEARAAAEAVGGHLATITSAAENDFVAALVLAQGQGDLQRYWLGGYQANPGAVEPSGSWAWVTGEAWNYANWTAGEPNDGGGRGQDFLHYWPIPGQWDDIENRVGVMNSYVIEYSVPEPTTLTLLGIGLAGFAASRRRRR